MSRGQDRGQGVDCSAGQVALGAGVVGITGGPLVQPGCGLAVVGPRVTEHGAGERLRIVAPGGLVVVSVRPEGQIVRYRLPGHGVLSGQKLVVGIVISGTEIQELTRGAVECGLGIPGHRRHRHLAHRVIAVDEVGQTRALASYFRAECRTADHPRIGLGQQIRQLFTLPHQLRNPTNDGGGVLPSAGNELSDIGRQVGVRAGGGELSVRCLSCTQVLVGDCDHTVSQRALLSRRGGVSGLGLSAAVVTQSQRAVLAGVREKVLVVVLYVRR